MSDEKWTMHFKQFRTRTEVRSTLTSTLTTLMAPGSNQTVFPAEISGLSTSNDREVMESYGLVKTFCDSKKGNDRRSVAATIGGEVRELFARALDRMKELPPEPVKRDPIISAARLVRRA
ncbi:MAG: hypothetical protein H7X76_01010 [Prolixibacteraceae bacterium]|nr:hypothetical protein [Burkholderiales bacterium]